MYPISLGLNARQILEVGDEQLPHLRMRQAAGPATQYQHFFHIRVAQAFEQDAFAYHARGASQYGFDFHKRTREII
ncbi:hypothetical protein ACFQT0_20000 [Hymenobacter humi]|uniref:Uncharacterized protein n=1 Tax=Hymenobacter humi TaxID=1411620 RepID=A0ABW2U792_9BACT